MSKNALNVCFWGVRGTVGVGGARNTVFGGHTSCIEVTTGGKRIIVDAGTGLVQLGMSIQAKAGDHFDILLSHLHHDHVIGLMLFQPCFVAGVTIDIYCGNLAGDSGEQALRRLFSPPLFPLTFDQLPAKVRFNGFSSGEIINVSGVAVSTLPLNHPNGATGYRFGEGKNAAVILTDVEHVGDAGEPAADLVAFCKDAGLLVYDATFDEDDYPRYRGWGHSTWEAGAALAKAAKAGKLACFHHAPEYDDTRLLRMEKALKEMFSAGFFAREGEILSFDD